MKMMKQLMADDAEDDGEILQTSPIEANKPPSAKINYSLYVPVKQSILFYGYHMMGTELKVILQ